MSTTETTVAPFCKTFSFHFRARHNLDCFIGCTSLCNWGHWWERFKRKWFVCIGLLANTHNCKHLDHSCAVFKFWGRYWTLSSKKAFPKHTGSIRNPRCPWTEIASPSSSQVMCCYLFFYGMRETPGGYEALEVAWGVNWQCWKLREIATGFCAEILGGQKHQSLWRGTWPGLYCRIHQHHLQVEVRSFSSLAELFRLKLWSGWRCLKSTEREAWRVVQNDFCFHFGMHLSQLWLNSKYLQSL